jgi:integrase
MPTPQQRTSSTGETTWRVRFRVDGRMLSRTFYDPDGAQTFCTWVDTLGADRALKLLEGEQQTTAAEPNRLPTLDAWADRYIESLTGASDGTKAGYRSSYAHSFSPILGSLRLDQIDRETVATALARLTRTGGREGNGYSDKTIANQHGLLSAMMATAVQDRLIDASPCAQIRLPRRTEHDDTEKRFLTEDEFWTLHDAATLHHRPILQVLVGTGIRWGEIEAVQVRAFDPNRKTLRITRAAKYAGKGKGRVIGPVKTRKSRRTIGLDDDLCAIFEEMAHNRHGDDLLVRAARGGQLNHKVIWEDVWVPACTRAGLLDPRPRIHDLRHTHASWLIGAGVDMKVVQERLGHESITTTMDLYSHLLPGAQDKAVEAMSTIWNRRTRPSLSVVS